MKTTLRISILVWLASFSYSATVKAQTNSIIGNANLCLNQSGIFTADIPCCASYFSWAVSGGATIVAGQGEQSVAISAAASGLYTLTVSGLTTSGQSFSLSTIVTVSQCVGPEIVSISPATCPDGDGSDCQNVCAYKTVTYEVINVPPGGTVTWVVDGETSYEANGNTVTVEWGGPGNGNLTAIVDGAPGVGLFQISCGIKSIAIGIDLPYWGGTAFLNMYGGTAPFTINLFGPNNYSYTGTTLLNAINLPPSGGLTNVGPYNLIVTDACGATSQCSFVMPNCCTGTYLPSYPMTVTQPSDCNACDGAIGNWNYTGQSNYPLSFAWSNGATTPDISGLCDGQYDVTVTAVNTGYTIVHHFTMDCDAMSCGTTISKCINILKIPVASIGSLPAANSAGVVQVCEGQSVFFENQSDYASSYSWDFGDLVTSTQLNPDHKYLAAGTYSVQLIARNECFCSDTSFVTVEVLPAQIPDIQCVGTVCVGETVTYSTSATCSSFIWNISGNGTILSGGGLGDNFITVEWNSGTEGSISLQTPGCSIGCDVANVVPVPIISPNVVIHGPGIVCIGGAEQYSVPAFSGASITWSVLGSGNIIEGQGTSNATIQWSDTPGPNPHYVIVEVENCYLGCSGKDTLLVKILNENYILGDVEICQGKYANFYHRDAITNVNLNANWVFENEAGTVISTTQNNYYLTIPNTLLPGKYKITATPVSNSNTCGGPRSVFITVFPKPPTPIIEGPSVICPGGSYSYHTIVTDPTLVYKWTVRNGSSFEYLTGNPINTTWGSVNPRYVNLQSYSTTGLQCYSADVTLNITSLTNFTVSGDATRCRETEGVYTANSYQGFDYQWSITPPDAGTIRQGQGSDSIHVLWHKEGQATVSLSLCGITKTFSVNVKQTPDPVVTPPLTCENSTVQVQTNTPFSTYSWKDVNGTELSNAATPQLPDGFYEVEVTDANGCAGDTIFFIGTKPEPKAQIYLLGSSALCPGGPPNLLAAVNEANGYDYQWFNGSTPVGINSDEFSTNSAGSYHVVVTNNAGCTAASNIISFGDCVSFGGQCINGFCFFPSDPGNPPPPSSGCGANGGISFNINQLSNCNEFQFTNTSSNFVPGTQEWRFISSNVPVTSSTAQSPTFTFPGIGYHRVILIGGLFSSPPGDTCFDFQVQNVLVPLGPDFEYSRSCPGTATSFQDRSLTMPGASIVSRTWDFGDPASGAANTSVALNPSHIFAIPGDYDVTLTVTEASGCKMSIVKTISVLPLPQVSFAPPAVTCEASLAPFSAQLNDYAFSVFWQFGDPASGTSNSSQLENSLHAYEATGSYLVSLTATNVYGCHQTFIQNINIASNNLSGDISFSQPSPICEGDQITLTAPPGGTAWLWSGGGSNNSTIITNSSISTVTITDVNGCPYVPPAAPVTVHSSPSAIIKAVEYNEFGQPVNYVENSYTICEGEDVNLVVQGSLGYGYVWSDGSTSSEINFTDDKGNLLPSGNQVFTVTITDGSTGCTSVEGPFQVTVNPLPAVLATSVPTGFLCENNPATLSVTSPQPGVTYVWNTGDFNNSINVLAGGGYFVKAINAYGCEGRSNTIILHEAPDPSFIPDGCHTRCKPDTICLPNNLQSIDFQWYYNGSPVPAPAGNTANFIASESGVYYVEMTDDFGCKSVSDGLTLELLQGFGTISGTVWLDENNNGVVDAGDTPAPGIGINIGDGVSMLGQSTSNGNGTYAFPDIEALGYTLALDLNTLPPGYTPASDSLQLSLSGCDDAAQQNWLLVPGCTTFGAPLSFTTCPNDSVEIAGVVLYPGMDEVITLQNSAGCDSIISVSVAAFPAVPETIVDLLACPQEGANFEGVFIPTGSSQQFVFQNLNGCDSVVTVSVNSIPEDTTHLNMQGCAGDTVVFNGTDIPVGTTAQFVFQNFSGCDSVVSVSVMAYSAVPETFVDLLACPQGGVNFGGVFIPTGNSQQFVLQNLNGCDSLVTVTVNSIAEDTTHLNLQGCAGDTVVFNGSDIPVGTTAQFVFQNFSGCDSVVSVSVIVYSTVPETFVDLLACPQGGVNFGGVFIPTGSSQQFVFQNLYGCDSLMTVTVAAYPTSAMTFVDLQGCPGDSTLFQGTYIPTGGSAVFTFQNQNGCDSLVTVSVTAFSEAITYIQLQACKGQSVDYQGNLIAAGDSLTLVFENGIGCDSVVTVVVEQLEQSDFEVETMAACHDASDGSINLTSISGGVPPYQFSLDGVDFQPVTTFTSLPSGNFTVILRNADGCITEKTAQVPVIPPLVVIAQDESIVCGEELELSPQIQSSVPYEVNWQNGGNEPTYSVTLPGVYSFSVRNACDTIANSIKVQLKASDPDSPFYIPNSFSPNGDATNDLFFCYFQPNMQVLDFQWKIFDRWGDLVFETNDYQAGWDGIFRDKKMNSGVYVWWLKVRLDMCGEVSEIFKKGDVTIMR